MTRLGEAGLTEPPLDADLLPLWLAYLNAWNAGNRKTTTATLGTFITQLTDSKHSEAFAWWVCRAFFDLSPYWSGQWGGGMTLRNGQFVKPAEFALSAYPILSQVMMPFLLTGLEPEDPPRLRWLCQFLIGQVYRIRPQDRQQIMVAVIARYGPDADPMTLLERAIQLAPHDPVSRSLADTFQRD